MSWSGKLYIRVLAISGFAAFGQFARADNIAIDLPRNTPGTQNGGYALGEDFSVGAGGIIVTDMAAFDPFDAALGTNVPLGTGPYDSIPVQIYYVSVPGQTTGTPVPGTGAFINVGNSHFVSANSSYLELNSFTPVTLGQGTYRLVAANYFNELEDNVGNGGTPTTSYAGPLIGFPGDNSNGFNNYADSPSTVDIYPQSYIDGGPINRYGAASFTFTSVPEPGSAVLIGAAGLISLRRRRA